MQATTSPATIKASPLNNSHLNPDLETPPEDTGASGGKNETINSAPPLTLDSDPESQD